MKKLIFLLAIGVWITSFAQVEVDRDQLSLDISKADAANTEQLKSFIWKKASIVTVDGVVKANTLSEFSFDEKGELQFKNIDAETNVRQKRGVRGRVQQSIAEDNLDYVEEALKVMISYTYMTKGQLIDFFGKADIIENDGIIEATASNVYKEGDRLTIKIESATKLFLYKEFTGYMEDDQISGEVNYGKFKSGISHVTTFKLRFPQKMQLSIPKTRIIHKELNNIIK